MKQRKLRIAWSVAWGIVAMLLVGLWVRSYWTLDGLFRVNSSYRASLYSSNGSISFTRIPKLFANPRATKTEWYVSHDDQMFAFKDWTWDFSSTGQVVQIPLWLPTIFVALMCTASWLPIWSNRFSLRALLIATTLIAVGLGLIVWLSGAR